MNYTPILIISKAISALKGAKIYDFRLHPTGKIGHYRFLMMSDN